MERGKELKERMERGGVKGQLEREFKRNGRGEGKDGWRGKTNEWIG